MTLGTGLIALGLSGPLLFFLGYPLVLYLVAGTRPKRSPPGGAGEDWPDVCLITAVRNAEQLVEDKRAAVASLDYPGEKLHMLFASDASTDATNRILQDANDSRIDLIALPDRQGKAAGLNRAAEQSHAEILVFSDADALPTPESLRTLVRHFQDPHVGGVCGLRCVGRASNAIGGAQKNYIALDSRIKQWESRLGRISSNDGKLFAMRRSCFRPIPPDVTDDLFCALTVISQGLDFIFEPDARAFIRVPSKNIAHELVRRRRIVCRSFCGIFRHRALLNPFRSGFFAFSLTINKILRRLLPFFLLLILAGSLLLIPRHPVWWVLSLGQVLAYLLPLAHPLLNRLPMPALARKGLSSWVYFVVGMAGSALGVLDALTGRRVSVWEPKKTEGPSS